MADLTLNVKLVGIAPTLMHCNQACNPLNKYSKAMKAITSKRKKTDEDFEALSRIEWESGLYYTEKTGPYIPAVNVEAMLRDAAKKLRKGNDVKQSLRVYPTEIPLQYDGPRKIEDLKAIAFSGERVNGEDFVDVRPVGVQGNTVMRTRPRFNKWSADISIEFDDAVFNEDDVIKILSIAGTKIGLSDYRPRYGAFEIKKL